MEGDAELLSLFKDKALSWADVEENFCYRGGNECPGKMEQATLKLPKCEGFVFAEGRGR